MQTKMRFSSYILLFCGLIALSLAQSARGEEDGHRTAYFANANRNLPVLRQEMLKTLDESRRCNPKLFGEVLKDAAYRASSFLGADLKPVDMAGVRNAAYASYNTDIWRFRTVSTDLHGLALAYSLPGSPVEGLPEIPSKAAAAFEWILSIASPKGTCDAPDTNIDRFAYVEFWEAFVLLSPVLSEDLKSRFIAHLLTAADYQQATFGKRAFPWGGGVPNMDAAYLLTMEQAFRLFEKPEYIADMDHRLDLLKQRMCGSTWEYVAYWNPQANYTQVTLRFLGRLYQLSGNPAILEQIQLHAQYYTYYLESNALMDYAMTPFIKHDWVLTPYTSSVGALDLVNRYASTPVTRWQVAQIHQSMPSKPDLTLLYWISDDSGEKAAPPAAFVRAAPEIAGFQARTTDRNNTLTVYGTGKNIAVDTRVSAIVSSKSRNESAILAGIFLELIQDGSSYYLGEMKPQVDLQTSDQSASLTVVQGRRMMGPNSKPLIFGNHLKDMKNWKFGCWTGGSPSGPPLETKENWTWSGDRLGGNLTVTAQAQTSIDDIKVTLPILLSSMNESRSVINGMAYRFGDLCICVEDIERQWTFVSDESPFDFRVDVPPGNYTVTVSSGAANAPTDPFDVYANGKKVAHAVQAKQGTFTTRTFGASTDKGSILLRFQPRVPGSHWKVGALSVASVDGKYSKKFAVGKKDKPTDQGILSISGSNVYNSERGYGWSTDLTFGERHFPTAGGVVADFITSPAGEGTHVVMKLRNPGTWNAGQTAQLRIIIGLGSSLDSWLTSKSDGGQN